MLKIKKPTNITMSRKFSTFFAKCSNYIRSIPLRVQFWVFNIKVFIRFIVESIDESWTECDDIATSTKTCESAGFIIISLAISLRALSLEDPWITCGVALIRSTKITSATILWLIEGQACTLARNNTPIRALHSQLWRANSIHIARATSCVASTIRPSLWCQWHWQVEAINKAHIIEILATIWCQCEFHQWCWWDYTCTIACDLATATIPSLTCELAWWVCGALCSSPKSTWPFTRSIHWKWSLGSKFKACCW